VPELPVPVPAAPPQLPVVPPTAVLRQATPLAEARGAEVPVVPPDAVPVGELPAQPAAVPPTLALRQALATVAFAVVLLWTFAAPVPVAPAAPPQPAATLFTVTFRQALALAVDPTFAVVCEVAFACGLLPVLTLALVLELAFTGEPGEPVPTETDAEGSVFTDAWTVVLPGSEAEALLDGEPTLAFTLTPGALTVADPVVAAAPVPPTFTWAPRLALPVIATFAVAVVVEPTLPVTLPVALTLIPGVVGLGAVVGPSARARPETPRSPTRPSTPPAANPARRR
jgi:hypothetical protein